MEPKEEKDVNRSKKAVLIIVIAVLIATVIAITYAFFTSVITTIGNTSVIIKSADIRITHHNNNIIDIDNFFPGDSIEKTFTVENQSNRELFYDISFADVATDTHFFETGNLLYELKPVGSSAGASIDGSTPTSDAVIQEGISIASGATHSYVLTITYIYAEEHNQIANIGASFIGRIDISSSQEIRRDPTP